MFVTNILLLNLLIALFRYVMVYILLNKMTPTSYINNNGSLFLLISLVYCKTLTCMALCSCNGSLYTFWGFYQLFEGNPKINKP